MKLLDEMDRDEELALVIAALSDKAVQARLRKLSRALVARIAALYRKDGVRFSEKHMTDTAMRQFNAVLTAYGDRTTKRGQPRERFAFVLTWWSTRRVEQMLRQ